MLIGSRLAARLQVGAGATLRLLLPEDALLANQRTRIAAVRVAGLLSTQTELDEGLIIGRLQDIAAFGSEGASANGLALQLDDLFAAPEVRWGLYQSLPAHFYLTDWTGSHGNLYQGHPSVLRFNYAVAHDDYRCGRVQCGVFPDVGDH